MSSSVRRSFRSFFMASLMALALALAVVAPAFAHGGGSSGPTYRAGIGPTTAPAGTASTTTVTLTQLVEDGWFHRNELGSARITAPAGFTVTGASATRGSTALPVTVSGGVVTVDKLDLDHVGQTAAVSIQATIACGQSGAATWAVVGHQTYTYSSPFAKVLPQDPTSQLTATVQACSLAFVAGHGPSTTGIGQTITNTAGDPSGPAIQVQLRDGHGNPAGVAGLTVTLAIAAGTGTSGAGLGGTTSAATTGSGVATFAPTIDLSGDGYKLKATAGSGIDPATSIAFVIADVAKACTGPCSGSATSGTTSATVSANAPGGLLTMTFGIDTVDCNNAVNHYYVATSEVLTFGVTHSQGRKTITIGLAAAAVTKPASKYEVCFSTPNETFVNKYGYTIAPNDPGILPTCKNCSKPSGGPCVVSRWKDNAGNVFVKFSVPMADPRGHI
jgi:hypothetical protein